MSMRDKIAAYIAAICGDTPESRVIAAQLWAELTRPNVHNFMDIRSQEILLRQLIRAKTGA